MSLKEPLLPAVGLIALTASVWVRLYFERTAEMRARRLSPQQLATSQQVASTLQHTRAADNFKNLFEVPVLFYTLCLALQTTGLATPGMLAGLWLYVALRCVHSFIHCGYNNVLHRFSTYTASTLLLLVLWGIFAVELIGRPVG